MPEKTVTAVEQSETPSTEETESPSQSQETVSDITQTPEFKQALEQAKNEAYRLGQSHQQSEIAKIQKELAQERTARESAIREAQRKAEQEAEAKMLTDAGLPEEAIKRFQDRQRKLEQEIVDFNTFAKDGQTKYEAMLKREADITARELISDYGLPKDMKDDLVEIGKPETMRKFAEKLAKSMGLIKETPKQEETKIDSSRSSGKGSTSYTDESIERMSDEEFEKERDRIYQAAQDGRYRRR